jgi:hypothetical protein
LHIKQTTSHTKTKQLHPIENYYNMLSKVIVCLLAILFISTVAFAVEEYGQTYSVATPSDSFSFLLEGSELLELNVQTDATFDFALFNDTASDITPPTGAIVHYAFTLTEQNTPTSQSWVITYTYDEVTRELYDETKTTIGLYVSSNWIYPTITRNANAMQVNASVSTAGAPNVNFSSVEFAVLVYEKEEPQATVSEVVASSEADVVASSSHVTVASSNVAAESSKVQVSSASSVAITYFTAFIAVIATILCL